MWIGLDEVSVIAIAERILHTPPENQLTCDIMTYARQEMTRLFRALTDQPLVETSSTLAVCAELNEQEVAIRSTANQVIIQGGSGAAVLHGVYTFFEKLGCVFAFSGEWLPAKRERLTLPNLDLRHTPSVRERGIRMHLNFFQDQSFFTEPEFAAFIDNMARQRFNHLLFHMYTPQQWFPFSYRGVKHLDQRLVLRQT